MNIQEQRKLSPPGREKNHICNKCGWAYPNPHPSAKHRRAHKKICGKPIGFKPIDSDDRGFSDDEQQQQNPSDDERQTLLPEFDKGGQSSDGVGGRPTKSEDEFTDAVTEFSPVDSEKSSAEKTEDSSPLLKVDANADSAPSPGTEGSYVGLDDSDKVVERAMEVKLDSSPLLKVDASSDSTDRPVVGVFEDDTEGTKKMEEDEVDEVVANVPEHVTRNLSESFETEIKPLGTDENTSPSGEDGVALSEQEQGGESELKMSDLLLEAESIHQNEENPSQNNGDSKVSASTHTEDEAVHILSVSEEIPLVGDSDNLIEDFKGHGEVKSNVSVTEDIPLVGDSDNLIEVKDHGSVNSNISPRLDSTEDICPLGDGDKDIVDAVSSRNMNIQEDSVCSDHIEKDNFALDADVVSHGDPIENSCTKAEGDEAVRAISVANEPVAGEHKTEEFKDDKVLNSEIPLVLGGSDDVKPLGDSDTSNSGNMIKTHSVSEKCLDEDACEVVNETKIDNGNEIVESVGSVSMKPESVDGVNAEVSEAPVVKEEKSPEKDSQEVINENKIVNEGDAEVSERISEEPILKEPSSGHLPYASEDFEQSITSHTAVEDNQNEENEQVAKGKDSPSKDNSGVDISADLSSQNSLEANWGSASVLSTQSDARASVDADNLRLSPQEPAKPEETSFNKSGSPSDDGQVNQSDTNEPLSAVSVVERGGGFDQNDAFLKSEEAAQNSQQPKPESLTEERKKTEEVMAKVANWSTEKHQSTPLKSLLGEADGESQQKSTALQTTTVKSVLRDEAPVANQTMNRDASKEWNSPANYPGSKKDGKKAKGKPSWIPFVCCSSVNVS